MAQALVRVGNSSNIKFNGTSSIRAITLSDVSAVLSTKSFEFVVFEGVHVTEVEAIKELRKDFRVPMYTFGDIVIDGIENHISLSDLQDAIEGTTGVWVRTYGVSRAPALWDKQYNEKGEEITLLADTVQEELAIEEFSGKELTDATHDISDVSIHQESSNENENKSEALEATSASSEIEEQESNSVVRLSEYISFDNSEVISTLISEVALYKDLLDSINSGEVLHEVEQQITDNARLIATVKQLQEENDILASSKEALEKQQEQLQESYEQLQGQAEKSTLDESVISNYQLQIDCLRDTLLRVSMSSLDILNDYWAEKDKGSALVAEYSKQLEEKALLMADMQEQISENSRLARQLAEYKRTADMQMDAVVSAKNALNVQLGTLKGEHATTEMELQEANALALQLRTALEAKEAQQESMEEELSDLRVLLTEKAQEIQGLNETLADYAEQAKDKRAQAGEIEALNRTILTMQQEVGNLQLRLSESNNELKRAESKAGELQKARNEAEITAKSYERRLKTGEGISLDCRYSGNAHILPMFGIGSHGITTTAVSVASKLNKMGKSVCILDFDLVNPKVNSFFKGVNPLATLDDDYGLTKVEQSCMGALMEKGVPWFVEHRHEFISTVQENRAKGGKRMDYFSGLYTPINMVRIIGLDYTELLNVLGNDYDYLIVDLGKIGASDIQDTLIRLFTRISLRATVVCHKDTDSLRNLLLKITANKLDTKKCVWFINMAKDSGTTPFIQHSFKDTPYKIMTFSNNIFGGGQLFSAGIIRGAFDEFVDELLLRGTENGK